MIQNYGCCITFCIASAITVLALILYIVLALVGNAYWIALLETFLIPLIVIIAGLLVAGVVIFIYSNRSKSNG